MLVSLMATSRYGKTSNKKRATCLAKLLQNELNSQPSPQAFSARSFLDSTMSCDVTERYSSSSRGQRIKRKCLGTRLLNTDVARFTNHTHYSDLLTTLFFARKI